jgi:hypothetical protein
MAKYLVLIYGDEKKWDAMTEQDLKDLGEGHVAFRKAAGVGVLGGHELQHTSTATTLRVDSNGRPTMTDGPFMETKEVLGGYYLVEAADLDQMISWAKLLPELPLGYCSIEIRPIEEHN